MEKTVFTLPSLRVVKSSSVTLFVLLEAANCTTLMISEVPWGRQQLGTNFEEFLGDGLIVLESSFDNSRVRRRIYIPKMRGTENRLEGYDYYITREGFALAPTPIPPDRIR